MAARMAVRSLSLLVLVAVVLRESCFGSSSHSLKYFYASISEPSQGLPHFVIVGYVDDQLFVQYDSHSRRMNSQVSWMEKVGKEDPQYWDRNTQRARGHEELFREDLEILRSRYNQSEGLHTWQLMYGCELRRDGSKGGFHQYGYEGRTFIAFDKETLTWVAPEPQAQITQRKWNAIPGYNQGNKAYLEEICTEWLEKYLSYGSETLLRTETPVVTLSSRTEAEDGMEIHVCRVHGFYPREIDAHWRKDGEVWLYDTFHGFLAPNADGTYHYWLSVWIDPKERGRYQCHVEHDSLQEPLDVALNGSGGAQTEFWECLFCTSPPVVTTSRTKMKDGMETHVCHMDGFYPREIDASWRKDGKIWLLNTSHGSVAPNADGTYRYWLSIQIDPKERGRYQCHVEHVGLQEPLDVALKETLMVTMSRTKMKDGMETHVCRMDGFYPREIDTSHGSVAPNTVGTNRYWLSIQIDPKERGRYQCHMEHESLQEPLDVAPKVPESNRGVIIGCVVALVLLVIVGTLIFYKKRRDGYNAASRSNQVT